MNDLQAFFSQPFWGGTIGDYTGFLAFAIAGILLRRPLARGIAYLTGKIFIRENIAKNRPLFRSLVQKSLQGLIVTLFLFVAFNFIEEPLSRVELFHWKKKSELPSVTLAGIVNHFFLLFTIIYVTLLVYHLLEYAFHVMLDHATERQERERQQLLPMLRDVSAIILWTIGLFSLLGIVFHVNIPALITGLGIGGVALALAAKESIENLLASFTILADKPFVLGDTIRMGDMEGKVERIGFRTTRMRDKDGIELVVPNRKLVSESLENLAGRDKRKIKLVLPLRYTLDQAKLDQLIESIRQLMKQRPEVQGEAEITITTFDEKALKLQVLYHLPEVFTDAEVQKFKDKLNMDLYSAILPALRISTGDIEEGSEG